MDDVMWQAPVAAWVERLQQQRSRAKGMRRRDMPKANGPERPLGSPGLAAKLLQAACARSLPALEAQEEPAEFPLGALHPDPGRSPQRVPPHHRGEASKRMCLRGHLARQRVHPRNRLRRLPRPGLCGGCRAPGIPTAEAICSTRGSEQSQRKQKQQKGKIYGTYWIGAQRWPSS